MTPPIATLLIIKATIIQIRLRRLRRLKKEGIVFSALRSVSIQYGDTTH